MNKMSLDLAVFVVMMMAALLQTNGRHVDLYLLMNKQLRTERFPHFYSVTGEKKALEPQSFLR